MLPTPDTSHVNYNRVYEPSEDSFLLLDTLSSAPETHFLHSAFPPSTPAPLVVELGSGSGVVLAFVHAHAHQLFGRPILTAGVDINAHACRATVTTVLKASSPPESHSLYLGSCMGDLASPWRKGTPDVIIFNPPYVPTEALPSRPQDFDPGLELSKGEGDKGGREVSFEHESYLLALSYAGGKDGMETTDRLVDALPGMLSERGCAYVLLCAQNGPEDVKRRIGGWGGGWRAETVGTSGKTAGWEKLQIVRIWRALDDIQGGRTSTGV